MTDGLIAFLRARLDEREAKARKAGIKVLDDDCQHLVTAPESLSWEVVREGDSAYVQDAAGTYVAFASEVHMLGEDWEPITVGRAEHIAGNDPAWVLADVESKRRIVDLHAIRSGTGGTWDTDPPATCNEDNDLHPCGTLRCMALPDAGHPDYRQEWRP